MWVCLKQAENQVERLIQVRQLVAREPAHTPTDLPNIDDPKVVDDDTRSATAQFDLRTKARRLNACRRSGKDHGRP